MDKCYSRYYKVSRNYYPSFFDNFNTLYYNDNEELVLDTFKIKGLKISIDDLLGEDKFLIFEVKDISDTTITFKIHRMTKHEFSKLPDRLMKYFL